MRVQDKKAEIWLTERQIQESAWEDSHLHHESRRKQLQLLQPILSQNQLILDAGCGPGNYGIILAKKNEVIGIDICSEAAHTARERANKENARFWPLVGDLERLPFKNDSFDTCFCGFTLHHFPDICNAVGELIRVAKPEGKIVLLEPNGSNPGVRISRIMENLIGRWLVKSGLETPNETIHKPRFYVKVLEQEGVADIWVTPHYFGGLPPMPHKSQRRGFTLAIVYFAVRLRRLIYIFLANVLPQPFNGAELLITATKKDWGSS